MSRSQSFFVSRLLPRISKLLRKPSSLLLCTLALLLPAVFAAAEPQSTPHNPAALIEHDRSLLANAERLKLSNTDVGILWARLGGEYEDLMQYRESEAAYTHALDLLEHAPGAEE